MFQSEGIDAVLRVDASIMLDSDLRRGCDLAVERVVQKYLDDGEVDEAHYLLSFILGHSEDKLQAFFEQNFSNVEIGILVKLRQQKHADYITAFLEFATKN